jgi:hypothetical protein
MKHIVFQISWVRRRDWHILTSGMFTYTNDERFQVLHSEGSDDWTLQIKYVQKRDNGTYECQVSVGVLPNVMATSFLIIQRVINIASFTSPIDCIFSLDLIELCLEQCFSYPENSCVINILVFWMLNCVHWYRPPTRRCRYDSPKACDCKTADAL